MEKETFKTNPTDILKRIPYDLPALKLERNYELPEDLQGRIDFISLYTTDNELNKIHFKCVWKSQLTEKEMEGSRLSIVGGWLWLWFTYSQSLGYCVYLGSKELMETSSKDKIQDTLEFELTMGGQVIEI